MLSEFKKLLAGLENAQQQGPDTIASSLTQTAFDGLVALTRAVYGEAAAQVVEESFTQREDGSMVVSDELVDKFQTAISGPT